MKLTDWTSTEFTASISGLTGVGDIIDLAGMTFTASSKATFSGTATSGLLTITSGSATAIIHLTGNSLSSTFTVQTDGHDGTEVFDPRAPSAPRGAPPSPGHGHAERTGDVARTHCRTSRGRRRVLAAHAALSAFRDRDAASAATAREARKLMKPDRRTRLMAAPALLAWPAGAETAPGPLADYERASGGRVGVFAQNLATGATLAWRANERFVMCSSFKASLAALVLTHVDRGLDHLETPIPYGPADIEDWWAPVAFKANLRQRGAVAGGRDVRQAAVEI